MHPLNNYADLLKEERRKAKNDRGVNEEAP